MPTITRIDYKVDRERYWIFVDGAYCTSVRARTFPALELKVGACISCEQIKERENHHWKHAYGQAAWAREKLRLNKVKDMLEKLDARITADVVGFGADTDRFIAGHPVESGKPDLDVRLRDGGRILMRVEVTGTEFMRGTTYWLRPDKLKYAEAHPEEDVWLVLHFLKPVEKFVFIQPVPGKAYPVSEKEIRGAIEHYVEFSDSDPEVVAFDAFRRHLVLKADQ